MGKSCKVRDPKVLKAMIRHADCILGQIGPAPMGGPYPKAYEMLSLFEGLVEYYRVTGDQHWKDCFMKMYDNVRKHEITIIGDAGADQPYHPAVMGEAWSNTALEQTNPTITRMMETCVGVTWIKICSQVLRLTGSASAADEIEKYVYNGKLVKDEVKGEDGYLELERKWKKGDVIDVDCWEGIHIQTWLPTR